MASCRRAFALAKQSGQTFSKQHIRRLSLHQYQSQNLLHKSGVPVPQSRVACNADEAAEAVQALGNGSTLNAQVISSRRRGRLALNEDVRGLNVAAKSPEAAKASAKTIFDNTAGNGDKINVKEIYVSEPYKYDDLWYLAMTVDREHYSPAIVISKQGGTDIQSISKAHPESIFTFHFGLSTGITEDVVASIREKLQLSDAETQNLSSILKAMHGIFAAKDATLLEIGSLAHRNSDGSFAALDSTFTFDDDAAKRQSELFDLRDKTQEISDEVAAEKYGLVYVRMDGDIGNVVNGAGLAMATNDAIGLHGGKSANFLDAGGQATTETMMQAFGIILRDERVKVILVNIYGGITNCSMIAESIIGAANEMDIHVPMVVRLQGTNSPEGLKLLEEANLGLHVESDFGRAAQRAVELAKGA